MRNSYGAYWGDHGEFLVQRGTNDFGIEGETTAYDPILMWTRKSIWLRN